LVIHEVIKLGWISIEIRPAQVLGFDQYEFDIGGVVQSRFWGPCEVCVLGEWSALPSPGRDTVTW